AGDAPASTASLASATLPRVFNGVGYRPLTDAGRARALFDFAAIAWPEPLALAWGAFVARADGERLVGAIVAERYAGAVMLHGPVVAAEDGPDDPLETAAQLVAAAMDHAGALGGLTIYTRPQGLDRVWVRFGFIPVPEVALPSRRGSLRVARWQRALDVARSRRGLSRLPCGSPRSPAAPAPPSCCAASPPASPRVS